MQPHTVKEMQGRRRRSQILSIQVTATKAKTPFLPKIASSETMHLATNDWSNNETKFVWTKNLQLVRCESHVRILNDNAVHV